MRFSKKGLDQPPGTRLGQPRTRATRRWGIAEASVYRLPRDARMTRDFAATIATPQRTATAQSAKRSFRNMTLKSTARRSGLGAERSEPEAYCIDLIPMLALVAIVSAICCPSDSAQFQKSLSA